MFSSRGKIRLSLFIIAAISMGTAYISLLYMNSIVKRVEKIANKDAKMAELGEAISVKILEARREEKNFIIYLDSSYIKNNREILENIKVCIDTARQISQEYSAELDSIELLVAKYSADIGLIAGAKLSQRETSSIITRLRETSNTIQNLAHRITTKARESLEKSSLESMRYGIKAQRNTITVFIIIGMLLIYLIFYLPHRIFLPFRGILRALKAIGRGETDFPFPNLNARDEFGELSRAFQDANYKIKLFNELKTNKIIDTERKLRRILEEVEEAILILTPDLEISSLNNAARNLFSIKEDVVNKPVREISTVWEIFGEQLENIEKSGRVEEDIRIKKFDPIKKNVSIIPNIDKKGELESIIIIVK